MPTPRPIITASVVVKSGMETTWLTRVMIVAPVAMPAMAVPTGRPIASTEPKATIRMKMAKARPSVSDDGGSKSPNISPPNSIWTPLIDGAASLILVPMSVASLKLRSDGTSMPAWAMVPSLEIKRSLPGS
jgi:hypothetical protein